MLPLEELYCIEMFLWKGKDKKKKTRGKSPESHTNMKEKKSEGLDFVKFSRANNFPSSFGNVLDCIELEHVSITSKS